MKESMWGYLIIALGIAIISILFLIQRLTTTNEQDYFLSREILKSSMYDAIDLSVYASSGKVVMSKEKFVEVFTRRFAESVTPDRTYTIDFYDIHEYPPKATIMIGTKSGTATVNNEAVDLEINTLISGILDTDMELSMNSIAVSTTNGDVDNNSLLNIEDVKLVSDFISWNTSNKKYTQLNLEGTNYQNISNADFDRNQYVNNSDLIVMKKVLIGLMDYPLEKCQKLIDVQANTDDLALLFDLDRNGKVENSDCTAIAN